MPTCTKEEWTSPLLPISRECNKGTSTGAMGRAILWLFLTLSTELTSKCNTSLLEGQLQMIIITTRTEQLEGTVLVWRTSWIAEKEK